MTLWRSSLCGCDLLISKVHAVSFFQILLFVCLFDPSVFANLISEAVTICSGKPDYFKQAKDILNNFVSKVGTESLSRVTVHPELQFCKSSLFQAGTGSKQRHPEAAGGPALPLFSTPCTSCCHHWASAPR